MLLKNELLQCFSYKWQIAITNKCNNYEFTLMFYLVDAGHLLHHRTIENLKEDQNSHKVCTGTHFLILL